MKHYVLMGASSAMAQHCARLWVQSAPARLTLVGRDAQRLQAIADDLQVRSPQSVIGSVAGDRGRKSNYVYGAAKGLVDRYLQGLQHRLASSPVRVVRIKPGPTDTPMTADLKAQGRRMASVEQVAADIMWVERHIPSRVFRHINL